MPKTSKPRQTARKVAKQQSGSSDSGAPVPKASKPSQAEIKPSGSSDSGATDRYIFDGTCSCSGNCGREPCKKHSNASRTASAVQRSICAGVAAEGSSFCKHCQCEMDGCSKGINKSTKRWCKQHGDIFRTGDYFIKNASQAFIPDITLALQCVCRANYLLEALDPDDNIAWQEFCKTFNEPVVGSSMLPVGVVVCLIAHAINGRPPLVSSTDNCPARGIAPSNRQTSSMPFTRASNELTVKS